MSNEKLIEAHANDSSSDSETRCSVAVNNKPVVKRPRIEYDCDICVTTFTTKRSLVRHQKTQVHCDRANTLPPAHKCRFCDVIFTRYDLRHRHEQEVHFNVKRSAGHNRASLPRPGIDPADAAPNFSRIRHDSKITQSILSAMLRPSSSTSVEANPTPQTNPAAEGPTKGSQQDVDIASNESSAYERKDDQMREPATAPFLVQVENGSAAMILCNPVDSHNELDNNNTRLSISLLPVEASIQEPPPLDSWIPGDVDACSTYLANEPINSMTGSTSRASMFGDDMEYNDHHARPSHIPYNSALYQRENNDAAEPPELVPDTASLRSVSTMDSVKARLLPPMNLLRSRLIHKGASPRHQGRKVQALCVLCNEHLGTSITEVRSHIGQHAQMFDTEFLCEKCDVKFDHEKDLRLHEASAAIGHCGFDFDHADTCSGHHPRDAFSEMLTDNDRLQFTLRLRHWSQVQVRAYLDQVTALINSNAIPRDGDCWSIDALRNSLISLSSALGQRKPRSDLQGRLSHLDNSKLSGALATFDGRRKPKNLASAALQDDKIKALELLKNGARINASYRFPFSHNQTLLKALTPLEGAIKGDHLDMVAFLIECGANVNEIRGDSTPLFQAVESGRLAMAQFLLMHGAHVNLQVCDSTALSVAVAQCDDRMVRLLLEHGAKVNVLLDSRSILRMAVSNGKEEVVKLLLSFGADACSGLGNDTLIKDAVFGFHPEIALSLQRQCVDGNIDHFHCASYTRENFAIAFLREVDGPRRKAIVGELYRQGFREIEGFGHFLHFAICLGQRDVIELLLDEGVDIDTESGVLGLPLAWAIVHGHADIVEDLVHRGAKLDYWLEPFYNALSCATMYDRPEIALFLIESGAKVDALGPLRRRFWSMLRDHGVELMRTSEGDDSFELRRC